MSKLLITYDLMQHFKVMKHSSTEKHMQAVCDNHNKTFLSISDDGKLRITSDQNLQLAPVSNLAVNAEKTGSTSGWMQKNLSDPICAKGGEKAVVTCFSISDMTIDNQYVLSAVVSNGTKDTIFYSLSKSISNPDWKEVNMPEELQSSTIYDIQINGYEDDIYLLLYVKQPNDRLQRYFVRSCEGDFSQWSCQPLAVDFDTITSTVLGSPADEVQGSYTLGTLKNETQILFTPSYNEYSPDTAPQVSRFRMPETVDTHIMKVPERLAAFSVPEQDGVTDLFACGNGILSIYPYSSQGDGAEPVVLAYSECFNAVKQLFAYEAKERVYVWLLNAGKELCYLYADLDQRYDPNAWEVVMMLCDGLDYAHLFKSDNRNAFYAYTAEGNGMLGYEDADTGLFSYEHVFTDLATGEVTPIRAFITNIKTPAPKEMLTITARGSGLFEINGRVYALNKNDSIRVSSNDQGLISIIQLTELYYAIEFEIAYKGETITINSDEKTTQKLLSLDSPEKLRNATILPPGESSQQSLIPTDTPDSDVEAAAQMIQALAAQQQVLSRDNAGLRQSPLDVHLRYSGGSLSVVSDTSNDMLFSNLSDEEMDKYSCEDVFSYLRSECHTSAMLTARNGWFDIIIKTVDNVCRFVVKTAKKVISFAINCIEKVVSSAKAILTLLVTDPKKILDFIKYMFSFKDILRTKKYMSHVVMSKVNQSQEFMDQLQKMMNETFRDLEQSIVRWGGLDTSKLPNDTVERLRSQSSSEYSKGNVQADYLSNLVTTNMKHIDYQSNVSLSAVLQANGPLDELLSELRKFAKAEGDVIKKMAAEIEQMLATIKVDGTVDLGAIFKKLLAIIGKGAVSAVSGVANLVIGICKCVLDSVKGLLEKEIYIPCVSEFLQMMGIKSFSLLDVILFIPAFSSTIVFKLLHGHAPITDADLVQLTNPLDKNDVILQIADKNDIIENIKGIFAGTLLVIESVVSFAISIAEPALAPSAKVIPAFMGFVATILQTSFLPASEKTEDVFAWWFGGVQLLFAFISMYFSSVTAPGVDVVFAAVSIGFHVVFLGVNILLCIYDISTQMLSVVIDTIKSLIDDITTATKMDIARPEAAKVLHVVRGLCGCIAGGMLMVGGAIGETGQVTNNPSSILA